MYKIKIQKNSTTIAGYIGEFASIMDCLKYWREMIRDKNVWGCWIVTLDNQIVRTIV